MRAIVTERAGDYDVMSVKDVALPVPGPLEVLVRNGASGVCYHDYLIRAGIMKRGIRFPLILGHDQLADTIALVASGKLRPIVTERFSFDEAPRVHRLMVEKKLRGRVLLVP